MKPQSFINYIKLQGNKINTSLGEITLLKNIGQGGNGLVYSCMINNVNLAVKFLVSDTKGSTLATKEKRFLAEFFNVMLLEDKSKIVKYISYDKIVVSDEGCDVQIPLIIMDLYESSLKSSENKLDEDTFKKLFVFLMSSVQKIHESGIIHRDIKPENILIKNEKFVLADFGIASYNPKMFGIGSITKKGERIGNRLFSAPEQEETGTKPAKTMDIYAIGQVLQWYATGKTHRGTGRQRVSVNLPSLQVYDDVIEICLANSPAARFADIAQIKQYITSREKNVEINPFPLLYTFDELCRSNFPKTQNYVAHSTSLARIDKFFTDISKQTESFLSNLWWASRDGDMYFVNMLRVKEGTWRINGSEYNIEELWIHQSESIHRHFILFKHSAGEPINVDGKMVFNASIVNGEHIISESEYNNGYAEIGDEIIKLDSGNTDTFTRMSEPGFVIIATAYNNAFFSANESIQEGFIATCDTSLSLTIEQIKDFDKSLRRTNPLVSRHF